MRKPGRGYLLFIAATCLSMMGWTELAHAAPATRVNVMPNREARPGASIPVWGNSGAGGAVGDGSSNGETYTWSFVANPNVSVGTDGSLTGAIANDRYIVESVTLGLLGGSTREEITFTLTVSGISKAVKITVVAPTHIFPPDAGVNPVKQQQVDVNIAIENGLRAMYLAQQADGSWLHGVSGGPHNCGTTGFSIWAFANSGHRPTNDKNVDIYAEWVQKAVDWVLLQAVAITTGFDPSGPVGETFNPDADGNGRLISLCGSQTALYVGYANPIAGAGLIAAYVGAPTTVIASGAFAGETYKQIIQDVVDWSAFAQDDGGSGQGGWRYYVNYGDSDTSADSWHYVLAEGFESTAFGGMPLEIVKRQAERRINESQSQVAPIGRFGYTGTAPLGTDGNATTAGGLSGLNMVSFGARTGFYLDPPGTLVSATFPDIASRKAAAVTHLGNRWPDPPGTWAGNIGNFYAMWTTARALRLNATKKLVNSTIPFDWETGETCPADPAPCPGTGSVAPPGDAREGYFSYLVRTQAASGAWAGTVNTSSWTQNLNTAWGVLVLLPVVFTPPAPVGFPLTSVPPANFTLNMARPGVPDDSFHEVAEFDIPSGVSFDALTEAVVISLSNPGCGGEFSRLSLAPGAFKGRGSSTAYFDGGVIDEVTGKTHKASIRIKPKRGTTWVISLDYADADFRCLEGTDPRLVTTKLTIGNDLFSGDQCFARITDGDLYFPKGDVCGP